MTGGQAGILSSLPDTVLSHTILPHVEPDVHTKADKASVTKSIRRAVEHHRAGRCDEAARVYRRVLSLDPAYPDALNLLGATAYQARDHARAAALMRRALEAVKPMRGAAITQDALPPLDILPA